MFVFCCSSLRWAASDLRHPENTMVARQKSTAKAIAAHSDMQKTILMSVVTAAYTLRHMDGRQPLSIEGFGVESVGSHDGELDRAAVMMMMVLDRAAVVMGVLGVLDCVLALTVNRLLFSSLRWLFRVYDHAQSFTFGLAGSGC